ncbi:MAG: hypothetical protein CM15mP120_01180 [Pseudomonadota bacterium]|nr:MAG: hypothetical protein CM15mP120_01180 [Pseudomonadota bacterium]
MPYPLATASCRPAQRLEDSYDFNVGLLTTQLRYRWEIAPLTDFFLVYNRGNSLSNALESTADEIELNDLLSDSFNEPVIDTFVAKLALSVWKLG